MDKKDVLKLKRRMNMTKCSISKIAGCYINCMKEKVVVFAEDFKELSDEEQYAKKPTDIHEEFWKEIFGTTR